MVSLDAAPRPPVFTWRLSAVGEAAHAVAAATVLIGYSLAPLGVLTFLLGAASAGGLNRIVVTASAFLALTGLLARGGRGLGFSAPLALGLTLAGWALLSTLWSIAPEATFGRALAFIAAIPVGLYLATFRWTQLAALLAATIFALTLLGAIAWAAVPELGRMSETHTGALRGLWAHKSTAGIMLAIGFAGAAALAWRRGGWPWWGLCLGFAASSVWAQSMTGLLGMAASLGALVVIWLVRAGPATAAIALGGGAAVALLSALALPILQVWLAEALGRDPSLTGRTDIWRVLADDITARLHLGQGFGAYWTSLDGPVAQVNAALEFAPGSAHNAWLEALLALGWPGLMLQGLMLGGLVLAAIGAAPRREAAYLALALLAAFLAMAASESLLLEPDAMLWPLLIALAAQKGLHRHGRTPAQP